MRHPFRLLRTGFQAGWYNLGLDEALLEAVAREASPPVLRFYGWRPAAVSLGYFQSLEEEVDAAACRREGVDIVRRVSGGGAVFHHRELTYSIILPEHHPLAGKNIQESYSILAPGIIRGLALLGVSGEFAPINDILAGGRKVSGNAQTRRRGGVLQHGTVLLDLDVELMFSLLKVPPVKVSGLIQDVKDRVTCLKALVGRMVSYEEAESALLEGFRAGLSLDFSESVLTEEEETQGQLIGRAKFCSPAWLQKK
ncbi:MAG: lipoate--protein ligase family protein [Spirochaetaceae bacterium]|jgi:lipoate-protein ligase A|nr:lipoate--protein ligase family protein [Spirochaetaceae bacterium]